MAFPQTLTREMVLQDLGEPAPEATLVLGNKRVQQHLVLWGQVIIWPAAGQRENSPIPNVSYALKPGPKLARYLNCGICDGVGQLVTPTEMAAQYIARPARAISMPSVLHRLQQHEQVHSRLIQRAVVRK